MIRKLRIDETERYCQHLLRLGPADRHFRFCGAASDATIRRYCAGRRPWQSLVLGFFSDGELRGAGELIFDQSPAWPRSCEAALSVEARFQNRGVGTELLRRSNSAAGNRWIEVIRMLWLKENFRMQAIAAKFEPVLTVGFGQIECEIRPHWPTMFTLAEELFAGFGPRLDAMARRG
ncbi:MAG: GNAT family N-acetyltransferase [Gammaproteobacteria bacterium]|nr:GNAT family N-acetyltransferase [Gammaproteobacteria bacterium]